MEAPFQLFRTIPTPAPFVVIGCPAEIVLVKSGPNVVVPACDTDAGDVSDVGDVGDVGDAVENGVAAASHVPEMSLK